MAATVVTVVGCMVVVLGFFAAFWRDLKGDNRNLRTELTGEMVSLRDDLTREMGGLRGEVHHLGERVARIEGRLDERDRMAE